MTIEHGNVTYNVNHPLADNINNDVTRGIGNDVIDNNITDDDTNDPTYSAAQGDPRISVFGFETDDTVVDEAVRLSMLQCDPPPEVSNWVFAPSNNARRLEPQYLRTLNVQLSGLKRPLENYIVDSAYLTETPSSWQYRQLRKLIGTVSGHMTCVLNKAAIINSPANERLDVIGQSVILATAASRTLVTIIDDESTEMELTGNANQSNTEESLHLTKTTACRSCKSSKRGGKTKKHVRTRSSDRTKVSVVSFNIPVTEDASDILDNILETFSTFKSQLLSTVTALDKLPAPDLFGESSVLTDRYQSLVELVRDKCVVISALLSMAADNIRVLLAIRDESIRSMDTISSIRSTLDAACTS